MAKRSSGTLGQTADKENVMASRKSTETLEQDARLDKFALWVKDVEREHTSDACV